MSRIWSGLEPMAQSTGVKLGATAFNREWRDRLEYLAFPAHCSARRTETDFDGFWGESNARAMQWTESIEDTDGMWSPLRPDRFTIPTGWAGLWSVNFSLALSVISTTANVTAPASLSIRVNDIEGPQTFEAYSHSTFYGNNTVADPLVIMAHGTIEVVEGDAVFCSVQAEGTASQGGYPLAEKLAGQVEGAYVDLTWVRAPRRSA